MKQAMESPHALDGRNCRALVGKARFSYFTDVCPTYRCNEPNTALAAAMFIQRLTEPTRTLAPLRETPIGAYCNT